VAGSAQKQVLRETILFRTCSSQIYLISTESFGRFAIKRTRCLEMTIHQVSTIEVFGLRAIRELSRPNRVTDTLLIPKPTPARPPVPHAPARPALQA